MFKYQYMELAIEKAKLAQKYGEVPIGAVIVNGNNIISSAHNISNDPTAHAEKHFQLPRFMKLKCT